VNKSTRLKVGLLMLAAATSALAAEHGWQYFTNPPTGTAAAPPFSEALLAGRTLYIAGHLGTDPSTRRVPADPAREAHLVLDAIQHELGQAGLSMDDLVSVTIFCTDLSLYGTFNNVYRGYFHAHYPTRAFIGVSSLLNGAHFEVEGIALKR